MSIFDIPNKLDRNVISLAKTNVGFDNDRARLIQCVDELQEAADDLRKDWPDMARHYDACVRLHLAYLYDGEAE